MPDVKKLHNLPGKAHIVGVGESTKLCKVPEKSPLAHHSEAAINALDDAGLQLSDVDALFTAGWSTLDVAEYLGIHPSYTDTTSVGGASFVIHGAPAPAAPPAGSRAVSLLPHCPPGAAAAGGVRPRGGRQRDGVMESVGANADEACEEARGGRRQSVGSLCETPCAGKASPVEGLFSASPRWQA